MAIVIAGERSGVGKTTVTLSLLAYLRRQGWQIQSFKVGPDYIDPMFHSAVTGRPCRNLDPVLTSELYIQQCFATHSLPVDGVLIEGVMGLFDGAGETIKNKKLKIKNETVLTLGFGSTAHVARLLNIPVVLVVDCSRMSYSVAALVHGYRSFDPSIQFAGVILNRVGSDRHLELLRLALEPLAIPILGVLRRHAQIRIPDRHLGLVPTAELTHFQTLIDQLADLAEGWFDWAQLLPLVRGGIGRKEWEVGKEKGDGGDEGGIQNPKSKIQNLPSPQSLIPIAIAQDAAFSFYYADNLELLEALGAKLIFWSPLKDAELPPGVRGLYLGGGFPEMFAEELSRNQAARMAVYQAIQAGMPTYAECGGLMYLCQSLIDFAGQHFPMVGILPTTAVMEKRLTLGYRCAIAQTSSPLVASGDILWGHEFHHSHLTTEPEQPLFALENPSQSVQNSKFSLSNPKSKIQNPKSLEGWYFPHLHASYIHLHWGDRPDFPQRFLDHCRKFRSSLRPC
ncbi:cobyrinate a,c-diamide synthase [Leptodesmis sp.]|uniref:cobyrinate a,c-diamide synthase n=1 Tax=Leptodesmis sp. TaxID=3100501 RepID=UPI0040534B78